MKLSSVILIDKIISRDLNTVKDRYGAFVLYMNYIYFLG